MIEEINKKKQLLEGQLSRTEHELIATIYNKERLEAMRMAIANQIQILDLVIQESNKEKDSGTDSGTRTDGDTIKIG